MSRIRSLTEGTPWKLILSMSLPTAAGYIFNQLYSVVDSVIVGRALGVNALAAVGATASINDLFCCIVIGTTVSAGVLAGQYYGKGSEKETAQSIANSIYLNLVSAVFLMIISIPFAEQWLTLFKTPASILHDAAVYMRLYLSGLIFMTLYFMANGILRAFGDSRSPLKFIIVSSISNIILDLLFVFGFHWGVFGAGLATTASMGIACTFNLCYSFTNNRYFKLALKEHAVNTSMLKDCAKIGFSLGFQAALICLSSSILQMVINTYGEITIAAFTVTMRLENIIRQPVMAWANSLTAFVSQNIGAGKPERVKQAVRNTFICGIGYTLIAIAIFALFGKYLVSFFVTDPDVISLGSRGMVTESLFVFGLAVSQCLANVLTGAGDTAFPVISGIVEIISRTSLCFLLTSIEAIGVIGIWITTGMTWCIVSLYSYLRYKQDKWIDSSFV